jgi:hypothetical protein
MPKRRKTFSLLILCSFAVVSVVFALYSMPITSGKSQNQTDRDEQKKITEPSAVAVIGRQPKSKAIM